MSAETAKFPRHVAIIMDGNGRWAQDRGLPRSQGHRAGAESVRRVVECCNDQGIEYLTLYAFSTENWRRPPGEVRALMGLLRDFLVQRREDLMKYEIRLNAIGELSKLPAYARKTLEDVRRETAPNTKGTLTLALSYGSRTEIVRAAKALAAKVLAGELTPEEITEERLARELYTHDLPDPDLIIRTAGEYRLSNFLLWQASYAEIWTTDKLWPDFEQEDFLAALEDFARRKRRFGGLVNA